MKQQTFAGVLCAVTLGFTALVSQAAPVSGQGTWETTLQGRDLDGNAATFEAYYDTTLDITWLADANYAKTSGAYVFGFMTWADANAWVAGLNVNGITGWRLPTMIDTGAPGCDSSFIGGTDCGFNVQTGSAATTVYSEMASLWYDTLGNLAYYDTAGNPAQPGGGLTNTGPFSNLQSDRYWSGVEYAPDTSEAWFFNSYFGYQSSDYKYNTLYGWAVRSGDVSAVPVPAAVWLFGSGLIGLLGLARRKR